MNIKNNQLKIKVLDLRDSPWVDGPGRTILNTASYIDKNKCEIIVGGFCAGNLEENEYLSEAKRRNLTIEVIREKSAFDLNVLKEIKNLIKKHSIHILHSHEFRSDMYGLLAAKQCGIKVVATSHGWIENNIKGRIYTRLDKWLLRYFDNVTTVSGRIAKELVEKGVSSKKVEILHNALLIDEYKTDTLESTFRKEGNFKDDEILIGNIGRLSPEKGQTDFITAAKEIVKVFPKTRFIIIGIGPDEQKLRQLVEDFKLSEYVVFTGYRKDMTSIYKGLDLVVQTSYTEGMPNIVLEALLMRVPVIATDVGGTSEIIKDNITGILIRPNSIEVLISYIRKYLSNKRHFEDMAIKGSKDIKNRFSFEKRTEKIMNIYEKVVNNHELININR